MTGQIDIVCPVLFGLVLLVLVGWGKQVVMIDRCVGATLLWHNVVIVFVFNNPKGPPIMDYTEVVLNL